MHNAEFVRSFFFFRFYPLSSLPPPISPSIVIRYRMELDLAARIGDNKDTLWIVHAILTAAKELGHFPFPKDAIYLGSPRSVEEWFFSNSPKYQAFLTQRWRRHLVQSKVLVQTCGAIAILPFRPLSNNGIYIWREVTLDGKHLIRSAVITSNDMHISIRMNARTLRDQLLGPELRALTNTVDGVPHEIVSERDFEIVIQKRLQHTGDAIQTLYQILCLHTRCPERKQGLHIDAMVDLLRGYLDYAEWIRSPKSPNDPPAHEYLYNEVVIGEICALAIAILSNPAEKNPSPAIIVHPDIIHVPELMASYAKLVSGDGDSNSLCPSPSLLLVPFVRDGHWTLLSYRREANEFRHYDSQGVGGRHAVYCFNLGSFIASYFPTDLRMQTEFIACPPPRDQLQRGVDCGYYVIAFAVEELINGGVKNMMTARLTRERVMQTRWADYRRLGPDAILLRDLGVSSLLSVIEKILLHSGGREKDT
jgi:hypothetical protein